jgi:hypothetical protein
MRRSHRAIFSLSLRRSHRLAALLAILVLALPVVTFGQTTALPPAASSAPTFDKDVPATNAQLPRFVTRLDVPPCGPGSEGDHRRVSDRGYDEDSRGIRRSRIL